MKKEPNKAPEPTPPSVMPRAGATSHASRRRGSSLTLGKIMSTTIRSAVPRDAPALRLLNHTFNGNKVEEGWIEKRLAAPASSERVLVAEERGAVVGFCCVSIAESMCYHEPRLTIEELFVAPECRRRGIGRKLVNEAIRLGGQLSASEIVVVTNQRNQAARMLYERSGFEVPQHLRFRMKKPNQSVEPTPGSVTTRAG